ncbi:hypothetical protein MHU86_18926 [Fragilaria crotonensis]|nr:hypothetical protein MHU86_18926 [Fragilaria crotonensis]
MAMQVNMAKFPNGNYSTILRMALQSTDRFRESLPKASTLPVIWDSGASISILLTARTLLDPSTPLALSLNCRASQRDSGLKAKVMFCGQCKILWAT